MAIGKLVRLLEEIRADFGGDYSPLQLSVLLLVSVREGITHTELAEYMKVPQATMSRAIARLSKGIKVHPDRTVIGRGLVENRQDELYDSRRKAVFLTDLGKEFVSRIKQQISFLC